MAASQSAAAQHIPPAAQRLGIDRPFRLRRGGVLPYVEIAY
jgi:hypothetical protein